MSTGLCLFEVIGEATNIPLDVSLRDLKVKTFVTATMAATPGFISIRTVAVVRVENHHVIGWVACASLVRLMAQSSRP